MFNAIYNIGIQVYDTFLFLYRGSYELLTADHRQALGQVEFAIFKIFQFH